jgi:hypothetical protein
MPSADRNHFLLSEELCIASLLLLRRKADDDTQAANIARAD